MAQNTALQVMSKEENFHIQELLRNVDLVLNRTWLPACCEKMGVENGASGQNQPEIAWYRVERLIYSSEDNVMEKLKTLYQMFANLQHIGLTLYSVLDNSRKNHTNPVTGEYESEFVFTMYLGLRLDNPSYNPKKIQFKEAFEGTFFGSSLVAVDSGAKAYEKFLHEKQLRYISCLSGKPAAKKDISKTEVKIGLEQFIDTMRNTEYTAVLIARPVGDEVAQLRKRELENFYSKLSPYSKFNFSFGQSESSTVSKSITDSTGTSNSDTKSFTEGTNQSFTHSEGKSYSDGYSSSSGSSGNGTSSSSGSSYTTSESTSDSQTFGSSKSWTNSHTVGTSISQAIGSSEAKSISGSINQTIEGENKNITNMLQRIDLLLHELDDAEAFGLWECAGYFLANEQVQANYAACTYKAMMLGDESVSEKIYVTNLTSDKTTKEERNILLNSIFTGNHPVLTTPLNILPRVTPANMVSGVDLPWFMPLPLKSVPGIVVDEIAAFERSVLQKEKKGKRNDFRLGCISHMGKKEDSAVCIDFEELTRHCFISGSTGSGKSNTMSLLLHGLISNKTKKINFLIVEPAKGEYKLDFKNVEDIKIFTTNPYCERLLHMNPFCFPEGIHVLEHIDRLLNIFGSCWDLTAAMPAILKKAVEQAYVKTGWNLYNSRFIANTAKVFPTFRTLVGELKAVIDASSYSGEVKGNYTGALVTRVESLSSGVYRQIFCAEPEVNFKSLFESRTIVDLSRLGSPETKTLIMGMLITLLTEHRMSVAQQTQSTNRDLQHVTVLEEAHNLLKNTSMISNSGSGNVVAKTVEMISNAIAEMRTYGEGFIIVDQSPTAVDISAIKNTNTKIVMRLPEQHDCEAMASAMGLNEKQQLELAKLGQGCAVVMQSGWTSAVLTSIDKSKDRYKGVAEISDPDAVYFVRAKIALMLSEIQNEFEQMKIKLNKDPQDHAFEPETFDIIKNTFNKIRSFVEGQVGLSKGEKMLPFGPVRRDEFLERLNTQQEMLIAAIQNTPNTEKKAKWRCMVVNLGSYIVEWLEYYDWLNEITTILKQEEKKPPKKPYWQARSEVINARLRLLMASVAKNEEFQVTEFLTRLIHLYFFFGDGIIDCGGTYVQKNKFACSSVSKVVKP